MAVPFFFIASGFLLAIKMREHNELENLSIAKNYIKKYFILYCVWTMIYMPLTIYGYITSGKSFIYNCFHLIRAIIFKGSNFYSWQLWYLLSLVLSACYIYLVLKFKAKDWQGLLVSFIILIIAKTLTILSGADYSEINIFLKAFKAVFENGMLFSGITYVTIGWYLGKYNYRLDISKSLVILGGGIVGRYILPKYVGSYFIILSAIGIFEIALNFSLKDSYKCYCIRKMSTVIYFTHMIFFFLYIVIAREVWYNGLDAFIVTTLMSILFSVLVIYLEEKKNIKVLKKIF